VPNQFELPAGKRFERKYMFQQTFKNIDDVLWKEAGCTTELDYTEQTSWMLFLEYLDDLEQEKTTAGEYYTPRPLIRAKIHVVNPKIGERIYGGKVGSAGFLCEAYVHLSHNNSARLQLSRIAGQIDGVQV
jgi:hypothetical protein